MSIADHFQPLKKTGYLTFSEGVKAGQLRPVFLRTAREGSSLDFMLNTVHARGNFSSHVTLKWVHLKQSGGLPFSSTGKIITAELPLCNRGRDSYIQG